MRRSSGGSALMAPPETPPGVAALRAAMTAAVNDPSFRADAMREHIEVDPVAGAEVEAIIRSAYAAPPEILARLNAAIKPPRQSLTAPTLTRGARAACAAPLAPPTHLICARKTFSTARSNESAPRTGAFCR